MKWFVDIARVFRREMSLIVSDMGVMIFFVLLPLAYPIVYTLIYNPEVVRNVPVVVVDDSRTPQSRELVRQASAAPAFGLYGYASDMTEAKKLWAEHQVYAIMHIPSDYDKDIARGEQTHVTMFCDMSLLLRYRSLLSAMTSLQIKLAEDITEERVELYAGAFTGMAGLPVESENHFLGDTQQGFASFVIPGIVVLILQQSMLLGIGMLGGTSRERRRANGGIDPLEVRDASTFSTVWGKALAYIVFYIVPTMFLLRFIPIIFNLPHHGDPVDYLLFIFPMVVATAFLGQALVAIIKEREYVFLYIVFTSVVFLFLSGLTWPRYAMSRFWMAVGNLVPATHGVEGFIRINSNAATLYDNKHTFVALWILSGLYFVLAMIVTWWLRRQGREAAKASAQRSPSIAADTMPPA